MYHIQWGWVMRIDWESGIDTYACHVVFKMDNQQGPCWHRDAVQIFL